MLRLRSTVIFLLSVTALGLAPSASSAQSALERLEQKVREQLGETRTENSSEELPSPSPSANQSQTNPSRSPVSAARLPSGDALLPSGDALLPSGDTVPAPSDVILPEATNSTAQVYLGLEAEQAVGGGIGVRVTAVAPQSPAWKAGFQVGDRILAVRNFAITNLEGMVEQLGKALPGESVQFLVLRSGRNINLTAVLMDASLAARLNGQAAPSQNDPNVGDETPGWLGIVVNDLTPSFRQQFAIPVFRGAAVTNVASGSPAQKQGIRAGDVVTEANGSPIEGERSLLKWMSERIAGERVELRVYRGSSLRNIELTLEVNPADRAPRTLNRSPYQSPTLANPPPSELNTPEPVDEGSFPPLQSTAAGDDASDAADASEQATVLAGEIQRLRAENQRLQQELEAAQRRLTGAQAKLNEILRSLKQP